MNYHFPCTIFVEQNSIADQIIHLASEVVEVEKAYLLPYIEDVAAELCDVIHSSETGLRILYFRIGDNMAALVYYNCTQSSQGLYAHIQRLSRAVGLVGQSQEADSPRAMAIALMGVIGTAKSALQGIARVHHVDIDACCRNVILKNDIRGYYTKAAMTEALAPIGVRL